MRVLPRVARVPKGIAFIFYFLWELSVANAIVAWEVLTPRHYMRPGIIDVPVRASTQVELALLANLISLTPGTLTLEIAADRRSLFVHALHIQTPERLRARIRRLEDRLLWVLR